MADGSKIRLDIISPVDVKFKSRSTTCRAMVLPEDSKVLLGSIPMEDMHLLVDTKAAKVSCQFPKPLYYKKTLR